jgi:putative hydrolase of the HAD superfamily
VPIRAVVCDFGGVLTTPLHLSFKAVEEEMGIGMEPIGRAMQSAAEQRGEFPLFELETARLTEVEFFALLSEHLEPELGHRPSFDRFREIYFSALDPNEPMVELMRELNTRGYQMALLTNNVREWEPHWQALVPVDEIFELVVDSAAVGMRKPDREIYDLTVERLDGIDADECIFIDDTEHNCDAARELGMTAVHFRDNDQAIAEINAALSNR